MVHNVYGKPTSSKAHTGSGYEHDLNPSKADYVETIIVTPFVVGAFLLGAYIAYSFVKIAICGIACIVT